MPDLFGESLAEARIRADQEAQEPGGTRCPCCLQHYQLYNRRYNYQMARALVWYVKAAGRDRIWLHYRSGPDWLLGSREFTKNKHWDLLERQPHQNGVSKTSGVWRPTRKGQEFVFRNISIPERALICRDKVREFTEATIEIDDVRHVHFNYWELMAEPGWFEL